MKLDKNEIVFASMSPKEALEFAGGYDKEKKLRCGVATFPNHISIMQKCPLSVKKRSRKR